MTTFRAMLVTEQPDGTFKRKITTRNLSDLPSNDTLVRVRYSSLNYKDALSASGNKGVTRKYPHTPGIDAAGEIVESTSTDFKPGDEVIVTSYDLGMNTSGGFGEYIRVPSAWVVKKPDGLSLRESMILGTAGFTAALCVNQLQKHEITPEMGDILVTGATGGVGCLAVAILSKLGHSVVAVTGKTDAHDWLMQIGAKQVIARADVDDASGKPLLKERWAGVVDTVGGNILATAIKATKRNGCVVACGLTQSLELHTTVYPFILRGVTLQGVDSAETKMPLRAMMWRKLAAEWKPSTNIERINEWNTDGADGQRINEWRPNESTNVLDAIAQFVSLEGLNEKIDLILQGKIRGRVVVEL